MAQSLECEQCGASLEADVRKCPFCGAGRHVQSEEPAPRDVATRLAAVRAHPEAQRWMAHTPDASHDTRSVIPTIVFLCVFIGIALFMTAMFQMAPAPMNLFPLVFVAFGVFGIFKTINRKRTFERTPLERAPMHVLDKQTALAAADGGGALTSLTLEDEHSTRRAFSVSRSVAAVVVAGDVGIAYFKGKRLIEFRPVKV